MRNSLPSLGTESNNKSAITSRSRGRRARLQAMRLSVKVYGPDANDSRSFIAVGRAAEAAGFESVLRGDHLDAVDGSGRPVPDAWTLLTALALATDRIHVGTLVSPHITRPAATLARIASTLQGLTGRRTEVGIGVGWYRPEFVRSGFPFPPVIERLAALERYAAALRAAWADERAAASKGPMSTDPWLIVGGNGGPRSLAVAAQHADEYDLDSADPTRCETVAKRLQAAALAAGRSAGSVILSTQLEWPSNSNAVSSVVGAYASAGVDRIHVLVTAENDLTSINAPLDGSDPRD